MKKGNNKLSLPEVDMAPKVMEKIRAKKIKMKHPLIFLAQKLGLESVLALVITLAALFVSIFLYFLKKTNMLSFAKLGLPGLKVVLLTLPYDYIALFIITILLANFILGRLDVTREHKIFFNAPIVALFVIATLMGAFFGIMGVDQITKGWSKNKIPREKAVAGRVLDATDKEAIIEDEHGERFEVIFNNVNSFPYKPDYARNKYLEAVGKIDSGNPEVFHADNIHCCD